MIIFKSHSTYSPTMKMVTTSNHYNLTGSVTHCEPGIEPRNFVLPAPIVTTDSATATNCVSLYDLRGIHRKKLIPNPNLLRRIYLARALMA